MILLATITGCNNKPQVQSPDVKINSTVEISFYVVNSYPHDPLLFTEGLLVHKGDLYESTGSPAEFPGTRSLIGIQDFKTGKLDVKNELDRTNFFGEGIAILDDRLYQLTYKNQIGFVYDLNTFRKLSEFKYSNAEGWGLTTDGKSLIMSDGTDKLTFLNPETLKPEKQVFVKENGISTLNLNELEWIKGYVYANIWTTNTIVKIDASTGEIVGKLDLSPIVFQQKTENPGAQELNGIAYDADENKILVTGKLWTKIYQLELSN